MAYVPVEGVDYLTDLYAAAGIPRDINQDNIHGELTARITQYHPDLLQGRAPELLERGERMTRLLNRARDILSDPERRAKYDAILTAWEGPISNDGIPIITREGYMRAKLAGMQPDEVEDEILRLVGDAERLRGYSPTGLEFLEDLIAQAGENVPGPLRAQYERALLERDRILAIEDAQRSGVLGRPDISDRGYIAGSHYAITVGCEIEATRQERIEELEMRALANVSGRLALLAGEALPEQLTHSTELADGGRTVLPAYFEPQAERLRELAERRQEVARRRLANFEPTYPEAEIQQEAQPNLVIGVQREGTTTWFSVGPESGTGAANLGEVPGAILKLLQAGELASVIRQGYNILTLSPLEQLDLKDLLTEAIRKASLKYRGDANE